MGDVPGAPPEVVAFVALGSNLGDRAKHLRAALRGLSVHPAVRVCAVSSLYETDPVGPPPQGPYFNLVAELRTRLAPEALLALFHDLEAAEGRERGAARNRARTLDLDLLLYGERQLTSPRLVVPHPRLHERAFVLEPLAEIAPDWVHPVLGVSLAELAAVVRDPAAVRRVPESLELQT